MPTCMYAYLAALRCRSVKELAEAQEDGKMYGEVQRAEGKEDRSGGEDDADTASGAGSREEELHAHDARRLPGSLQA